MAVFYPQLRRSTYFVASSLVSAIDMAFDTSLQLPTTPRALALLRLGSSQSRTFYTNVLPLAWIPILRCTSGVMSLAQTGTALARSCLATANVHACLPCIPKLLPLTFIQSSHTFKIGSRQVQAFSFSPFTWPTCLSLGFQVFSVG